MKSAALTVLLATLTLAAAAGTAQAAPMKRLVWKHAVSAWTAQAKTHGAKTTCDPWTTKLAALTCEFKSPAGRYGASLGADPRACTYQVTLSKFYDTVTTRRHMLASVDLSTCKRGWWLTLPGPWTQS